MWLHEQKVFRGIPLKYKNEPVTSSALRKNELAFLESVFKKIYGNELLISYKEKCVVTSSIKMFRNVSPSAAWAWFLLIINIILKIKQNSTLMKPLQFQQVISMFENCIDINIHDLPEEIFKQTESIFKKCEKYDDFMQKAMSYTYVSSMIYGLEYFQHVNFDVRGNLDYNPYPTMVLDWTEDIGIANHFSYNNNEPGIVCCIDYNNYKKLLYDEWYELLMHADLASGLPGFTPYVDYHFFFAQNNKNMQNQKGVVLFWPWSFCIDEMSINPLGQRIGFEVINISTQGN